MTQQLSIHASTGSPAQVPPSLVADSLTKRFGRRTVLEDVSLRVYPGQLLGIAGPSGSGKSTLLNLLSGMDKPTSGQVNAPGRTQRGFIFQRYNLIESLTARQNAAFSAQLLGRRPSRASVDAMLDLLGLTLVKDQLPHAMSGGEQQRVAVGRVLLSHVPFIFADEPTGALDNQSATIVLDQLRAAADAGATVLMVTHTPAAMERCDRVMTLAVHA